MENENETQPAYDGGEILLKGGSALPVGTGDGGDLTLAPGPEPITGWRDDDQAHRDLGPLRILSGRGMELVRLEGSGDMFFCGRKVGSVPAESLCAFVWSMCHTTPSFYFPPPGGTCTFNAGAGAEGGRDGLTYLQGAQGELLVAFGPGDELRGPDDKPLTPAEALDGFREFLHQLCGV